MAQLRDRIAEHRLVTLTGEGGSGKTRLAASLCNELKGSVDEVWWVDLGPVTDPAMVASTVAETLGIRIEPEADPIDRLVRHLEARTGILCLDTCEHVLDAVADLTHRVLAGCEHLVALATSREALGVPGEAVYRVPRLSPADASQLFAERAALSDARFSLAGVEGDVTAICARVDGLPLAVELAAAWVQALTPSQIAAGLEDNLQLLGGGPGRRSRGTEPWWRPSTGATTCWLRTSRAVLRRLAVFGGDFTTAEAATAVAGETTDGEDLDESPAAEEHDVLVVTRRLVDKSLVVTRRHGDQVRYRLLDTVRHYALDKLRRCDEVAPTRDRHLRHYLDLALEAEAGFAHDQDHWRVRLETERDNIQDALQLGAHPGQSRDRQAVRRHDVPPVAHPIAGTGGLGLPAARARPRSTPTAPRSRPASISARPCSRWLPATFTRPGTPRPWPRRSPPRSMTQSTRARATAMRAYSHFFVDPAPLPGARPPGHGRVGVGRRRLHRGLGNRPRRLHPDPPGPARGSGRSGAAGVRTSTGQERPLLRQLPARRRDARAAAHRRRPASQRASATR